MNRSAWTRAFVSAVTNEVCLSKKRSPSPEQDRPAADARRRTVKGFASRHRRRSSATVIGSFPISRAVRVCARTVTNTVSLARRSANASVARWGCSSGVRLGVLVWPSAPPCTRSKRGTANSFQNIRSGGCQMRSGPVASTRGRAVGLSPGNLQENPIHLPATPTPSHRVSETTATILFQSGAVLGSSAVAALRRTVNVNTTARSSNSIFIRKAQL
jgi:hypothetical protein